MTFESLLQRSKELKKQLADGIKEELTTRVKAVFDAEPKLASVSWDQYAPYFNDGEPCTFSVKGLMLNLSEAEPDEDEGYDEDRLDTWGLPAGPLKDAAKALESLINDSDLSETMEMAFGDSVEVTISKDGEVTVSECDHD